jgi:sensor c-di-GMP phosphodiesterase-like protein
LTTWSNKTVHGSWHDQEQAMYSFAQVNTALDHGDFFLEYMPTMSLSDGRCVGAETLIRWQNGATVIYPADFIPAIEATPLSGLITYWVIETVAKELLAWLREQAKVRISINIPPEVIGRGGIAYAAAKSKLSDVPDKLMFEVTERGLLDALGVFGINLAAHSDVLVALDDLVLNDASLLVLSRVKSNVVKLDKSFADDMLRPDWTDRNIAGIAALIKSGNLRVIAEGVETPGQAAILKHAGVQMAQGWYFSPSLRADDFMHFHAQHQ